MSARPVLDVSHLPTYAFGTRSLTFWGTIFFLCIEGTLLAGIILSYFFLQTREPAWPPGLQPPELWWGTLTTLTAVASGIPNALTKRAAERMDLPKLRLWMTITTLFIVGITVSRVREFSALNCSWDTNAYGSIVWMLLGFHTTHVLTDWADTLVLLTLMFVGPIEGKHFVDVSENALYWYVVIAFWIPVYLVIYWVPRWI
jgi:cytochrome c oxidase subunit 3